MPASRWRFNEASYPGLGSAFAHDLTGGYTTAYQMIHATFYGTTGHVASFSASGQGYEGTKSIIIPTTSSNPVEHSIAIDAYPNVYLDCFVKMPSSQPPGSIALFSLFGWEPDRGGSLASYYLQNNKSFTTGTWNDGWGTWDQGPSSSVFSSLAWDGTWVRMSMTSPGREFWSNIKIYQGGDLLRTTSPTASWDNPAPPYGRNAAGGYQIYSVATVTGGGAPFQFDDVIVSSAPIVRTAGSAAKYSAGLMAQ